MQDFAEFKAKYPNKTEAFRRHWAPEFKNLFGGSILIGGRQIGSGGIISAKTATSGESPNEKGKGPSVSKGAPPPFNPITEFLNLLKLNYQGQRLDKMVELQNFALKDKESYPDAYHRLTRLVDNTEGIMAPQSIQYWFGIMEAELKELVRRRVSGMPIDQPATLEAVLKITDAIAINLAKEKALQPNLGKKASTEKIKQPKAVVAAHGDVSTFYDGREKFCFECGSKTRAAAKCWILYPKMRPTGQSKPRDRPKAAKVQEKNQTKSRTNRRT